MVDSEGVRESLSEIANPLSTTDPTAKRTDLDAIVNSIGTANVIGLGEGTHGTREFFHLKDRLVRHLVESKGLRLIALEANLPETTAINECITEGTVDTVTALSTTRFWPWHTEELLALVEWLRDFNDGRSREDQVKFYGVDMQCTSCAAHSLESFLEQFDSGLLSCYEEAISILKEFPQSGLSSAIEGSSPKIRQFITEVGDRLVDIEEEFVDDFSRHKYELVRRYVRILEQTIEYKQADDIQERVQLRDRAMAENALWVYEHEQHDKMVLWAHNVHVRRGTVNSQEWETVRTMGDHLSEHCAEDYYPLGFDFGRGRFQALTTDEDGTYGIAECELGKPREDSISNIFATIEEPQYFLDSGDCVGDETLNPWFTEMRKMRSVDVRFHGQDDDIYYETVRVGEAYDGLIFVADSERARPLTQI